MLSCVLFLMNMKNLYFKTNIYTQHILPCQNTSTTMPKLFIHIDKVIVQSSNTN